tara:strand:- start:4017 stop:4370 length:354 start_codon:yes stop_codon:yes gene_type:complete
MLTKEELVKWLSQQKELGTFTCDWEQEEDWQAEVDGWTTIRFKTGTLIEKEQWMKLQALKDLLKGWCEGQPEKLQYRSAEDILHKPLDIYDQEVDLNGEQKAVLINFIKIWKDIEEA